MHHMSAKFYTNLTLQLFQSSQMTSNVGSDDMQWNVTVRAELSPSATPELS